MAAGRYAPSPSGPLHLGNLRTAVAAWLLARSTGRDFHLRIEDIDTQRSSRTVAEQQISALRELGITWDGPILWQSERDYWPYLDRLPYYECYCSRRDIQEAARAPHSIPGQYPGTCRDLTEEVREEKRAQLARDGRHPALRLRAEVTNWTVQDRIAGTYVGAVDDMVLRRGGKDPGWAYNLAVIVDDAYQGVDQVVRGNDLLSSAPRQAYLASLLGFDPVEYVHVPLVLDSSGKRLSKRDGDVAPEQVIQLLAPSFGAPEAKTVQEILRDFDWTAMPTENLQIPVR